MLVSSIVSMGSRAATGGGDDDVEKQYHTALVRTPTIGR
jgi:hypothetical protein